jgi:hypothetical protein
MDEWTLIILKYGKVYEAYVLGSSPIPRIGERITTQDNCHILVTSVNYNFKRKEVTVQGVTAFIRIDNSHFLRDYEK